MERQFIFSTLFSLYKVKQCKVKWRTWFCLFSFLSYYFSFLSFRCFSRSFVGRKLKFLRQYSEKVDSFLNPLHSLILDMGRSV